MTDNKEFDPQDYLPKPTEWFKTEISYEGLGHAELDDPRGWVEGHTKISLSETGVNSITMQVEAFEGENLVSQKSMGLMQLLSAETPEINPSGDVSLKLGKKLNTCLNLTVETPEGIYVAHEPSFTFSINIPGSYELLFYPFKSEFITPDRASPKYWVLPLLNFVSHVTRFTAYFNEHPLRLHRIPNIPDGLSEKHRKIARFNSNSRNFLVVFDYGGKPGFIERLPNYEERHKALVDGTGCTAVTAIMVGELDNEIFEAARISDWKPMHLLNLLALATGIEVDTPWIELRSETGALIRRIHKNVRKVAYLPGYVAIEEPFHTGIGELLSNAIKSPKLGQMHVQAAMYHTVLGSKSDLFIEDRLAHLFRALDSLCEGEKVYQQVRIPLSEQRMELIKEIIKQTYQRIRSIAQEATMEGHREEARLIENQVAQRVAGATAESRLKFNAAIAHLLEQFGFPDAIIMREYYQSNPRPDELDWLSVLSKYRGVAIHENVFDFDKGYDINDVAQIMKHINDILLRLIFKMLGYNGTYQPPVVPQLSDDKTVSWLTEETPASEIGYL